MIYKQLHKGGNFWSIKITREIDKWGYTIREGCTQKPERSTKTIWLYSEDEALRTIDNLVTEKLKKGYKEYKD